MDKTREFLPPPPSFIKAYLRKTQANPPFCADLQCWCLKLLKKSVLKKKLKWNKNFVQLYHNTLSNFTYFYSISSCYFMFYFTDFIEKWSQNVAFTHSKRPNLIIENLVWMCCKELYLKKGFKKLCLLLRDPCFHPFGVEVFIYGVDSVSRDII